MPGPGRVQAFFSALTGEGARDTETFRRALRTVLFLLFGDDAARNLVVGGLGQDLLVHEIGLGTVRPAVDDFLRVGVADSGEFLELLLAGRIDVQQLSRRFRRRLRGGGILAALRRGGL